LEWAGVPFLARRLEMMLELICREQRRLAAALDPRRDEGDYQPTREDLEDWYRYVQLRDRADEEEFQRNFEKAKGQR
jgi:hypothetical protein